MVTIFDGMERMNEEQLRYEIALLEQVSVAGFAKIAAQKVKQTSMHLAGKVTNLLGAGDISEPVVVTMDMQVALAKEALKGKSAQELQMILKANLCQKAEELGISGASQMNREKLSAAIVSKAAEAVEGVPSCMTTLRKAEAVADKNKKDQPEDFRKTVLKNKMTRELLAHTVSVCVRAYGEKFSPAFMTLPGFLSGEAKEQYLDEERKVREAMDQSAECKAECVHMEQAMEMSRNLAATQKSEYQSLEEKEDYLVTKQASEEDTEEISQMLAETRAKMEECLKKQKEYEEAFYAKQAELELLKDKNDEAGSGMLQFTESRKNAIKEAWQQAFPSLDFKDGVLSSVARSFMYDDRISLEEALKELTMAEHAGNLDENSSKDALFSVFRFSLDNGSAGRIAYHVKGDRILILQIQKSK